MTIEHFSPVGRLNVALEALEHPVRFCQHTCTVEIPGASMPSMPDGHAIEVRYHAVTGEGAIVLQQLPGDGNKIDVAGIGFRLDGSIVPMNKHGCAASEDEAFFVTGKARNTDTLSIMQSHGAPDFFADMMESVFNAIFEAEHAAAAA